MCRAFDLLYRTHLLHTALSAFLHLGRTLRLLVFTLSRQFVLGLVLDQSTHANNQNKVLTIPRNSTRRLQSQISTQFFNLRNSDLSQSLRTEWKLKEKADDPSLSASAVSSTSASAVLATSSPTSNLWSSELRDACEGTWLAAG